jgi:ABC-type molybdate transport system substrate-binding protein
MKWQKAMLAALVLAAFAAVSSTSAGADDVRLAAAVGVRQILLDLLPGFEAQTSHKVHTTFEATGILVQQVSAGASFVSGAR